MRTCVYLRLDGFYLRTLGLESVPAVVYRDDRLIAASDSSARQGVGLQLSLKEAKMILLEKGVYTPYVEADYREAAEKWLQLLLKYSDTIQPETPASAFVDLSRHPQPREIAALLFSDLHRHENLPIQAGIASYRWLARVSAQACDKAALRIGIMPIQPIVSPRDWLAPQRLHVLTPLPPEIRVRLSQLGIQYVREIQELSPSVLDAQFPRRGRWIRKVAEGSLSDPVVAEWPPQSFSDELGMNRCESELELDEALRTLATRAAHHLCATDQAASRMKLCLRLESGRFLDQDRAFKRQVQTASQLHTDLRQLLQRMDIDEPVEHLRIWLLELRKSTRQQTTFSYGHASDVCQLNRTLARLQDAYGEGVVIPASQVKHGREKRVLKAWKEAYGWQ